MTSVFERVQKIIVKQLNMDEEYVTRDALFADDLGADSIDSVELIMAFETEFKQNIPEKDAEAFRKVDDVVKYLESRVGNQK
jgi:acyl carrier protein